MNESLQKAINRIISTLAEKRAMYFTSAKYCVVGQNTPLKIFLIGGINSRTGSSNKRKSVDVCVNRPKVKS